MSWYSKVSQDISHLPDCIEYFYSEIKVARAELKVTGNIERAAADLPGIVEYRFNQLQEIEGVLEYLNIELRRVRSKAFKKYLENYARALSSRDCERYVDGEADVVDLEKIVNEFALLRNQWLGIIKALENKSFSINNIIKLRTHGMEDIWL